jgi:hypothetical protein
MESCQSKATWPSLALTRKVRFAVEGPTPPTKDPWGNTRDAISAITKINQKDFGLTWNAALETGGILVGDEGHHHSRCRVREGLTERPKLLPIQKQVCWQG